MTMHLRGVRAGLFTPGTDEVVGEVSSCDCAGADAGEFITDCLLALKTGCGCPQQIDGRNLGRISRAPDVISAAMTAAAQEAEPQLDQGFYLMLSDPIVGGILLGRREAVDKLWDAPSCQPLDPLMDTAETPPSPFGPPNPACPPPDVGADTSVERIRGADTIEAIHVTADGLGVVRARENR